ncbi:hypothetical protein CDD80_4906 [Ophiocordyceps camponoti-rufipedis]|uniref:Uncharacterized protein n=1 Tax=Ophiocordyceps camponoti-rufipedis TaxID=2004952 RepID=A0A2C5YQW8_9HYPO|nr:hypothetical protein CDD80_4906 [Ophiocordyceps camponoti-rufipedis]
MALNHQAIPRVSFVSNQEASRRSSPLGCLANGANAAGRRRRTSRGRSSIPHCRGREQNLARAWRHAPHIEEKSAALQGCCVADPASDMPNIRGPGGQDGRRGRRGG